MHWEGASIKKQVSRAGPDHRGNLLDKKASDAGVCIQAALHAGGIRDGTVARGAVDFL